jgi:hypothetical protein
MAFVAKKGYMNARANLGFFILNAEDLRYAIGGSLGMPPERF